ncbi:hypothetical protein P8452_63339 [Trifolium repens]|nr:hypothetical protein P8452_63339 [Trifolium repens]
MANNSALRLKNHIHLITSVNLELGLEPTLPYLSSLLVGEKLLIAANFASARIGVLNDTEIQFVSVTCLYYEIEVVWIMQEQ